MSDLKLTPHRELPPDVRERLRTRVLDGMNGVEHHATVRPLRRPPAGAWLAAAAATVAVAAVGIVVVQGVDGNTVPVSSTEAQLDRCSDGAWRAGNDRTFPPRDTWRPVLQTSNQGATVHAIRAEGVAFFCGLTPTAVTLSVKVGPNDTYANPSEGALPVLEMPGGPLAGFTDHRGTALKLDVLPPADYQGDIYGHSVGKVADGMFVHPGPGGPRTQVRYKGNVVKERARQGFTVIDHPELRAERTSPKGRLLGQCLDDNWYQVADGDSLQVEASVKAGSVTAMVMRNSPRTFGLCAINPANKRDVPGFYMDRDIDLPSPDAPVQLLYYEDSGYPRYDVLPEGIEGVDALAAGTVSSEVKYVSIGGPDGSSSMVPVVDGTFVLTGSSPFVEFGPEADSAASRMEAVAYDARGDEIWSGEVYPFKDDG